MTEAQKATASQPVTRSEKQSVKSGPRGAKNESRNAKSGRIRIQWFRSAIATPRKHKAVVRGLGFTRLNQIIEREDSSSIRGMVNKVPHLVKIVA